MAMSEFENRRAEKLLADYVARHRPPPHIRPELDLGWRRSGQSVELFEIRPRWRGAPGEMMETPSAKATWAKTRQHWRVFWMRRDLKWHGYEPAPLVHGIEAFFNVVDRDDFCCFFG